MIVDMGFTPIQELTDQEKLEVYSGMQSRFGSDVDGTPDQIERGKQLQDMIEIIGIRAVNDSDIDMTSEELDALYDGAVSGVEEGMSLAYQVAKSQGLI